MKPIKLEIEGIQSFVTLQTIDFEKLTQKGIFGIFGATGSGKSTILDCITLSLFGKINRSKINSDFVNNRVNKARVSFTFSLLDNGQTKILEVERIFRRKKSENELEQFAQVFEMTTFGKKQIVEGAVKTDNFVKDLFGMGENEFSKCIALPQGEFAGFLKAKPNERVNIIGNIFDLHKYGVEIWDKARKNEDRLIQEKNVLEKQTEMLDKVTEKELESIQIDIHNKRKIIASGEEKLQRLILEEKEESLIVSLAKDQADTNKKINQLETSFKNIDQERIKFERANKIVPHKSKILRTEILIKDIETRESELKEIENKLVEQTKIVKENNDLLENIKPNNEKLIEESIAKIQALKNLKENEYKIAKIKQQILEINKELDEKKKEAFEVGKTILFNSSEIEKLDFKISELNEDLNKIVHDIEKLAGTLNYNNVAKEVETIGEFIKKADQIIDYSKIQIRENKQNILKINSEEKIVLDKISLIKDGINKFVNVNETNSYLILRNVESELLKIKSSKHKIELYNAEKTKLLLENDEILDSIKLENEKLDELKNVLSQKDTTITELKKSLEKARELREENLGEAVFSGIVDMVQIGEDCPICKSRIVQKNIIEKTDLTRFDNEIAEIQKNIKKEEESREAYFQNYSSIHSKIDERAFKIKLNNKKSADYTKLIEAEYIKFVDLNDYSKENFENRIVEFEDAVNQIVDVIKIEEEYKQSAENLSENKLSCAIANENLDNFIEQVSCLVEFMGKIRAEKEFEFSSLAGGAENLDQLTNELNELEAKRKFIVEELNSKTQSRKKYFEQLEKGKEQNNILKTEIATIETKIDAFEKHLEELENEIKNQGPNSIEVEIQELQEKITSLKNDTIKKEEEYNFSKTKLEENKKEYEITEAIYTQLLQEKDANISDLNEVLVMTNLNEIKELKQYLLSEEDLEHLNILVNDYDSNYSALLAKRKELEEKLEGKFADKANLTEIEKEIKILTDQNNNLREEVGKLSNTLVSKREAFTKSEGLNVSWKKVCEELDVASELVKTLKGKGLLEFVAEEFIDDITYLASSKLQYLMDGHYELKYNDKEFYVIDNYENGQKRSVSTLSGGETFVVSLALALSISESIAQSSNKSIDFFFLDEGFGTLDNELCEYIINSLIKLESRNITIGLISHVPELKEHIKEKLIVKKEDFKIGSTIEYISEI